MSLQIFVIELIIDIITYFTFWFLIILAISRINRALVVPKFVTIILLSTAGLFAIVLMLFAVIPDNIYTVTRKFDIDIKETGYRFVWQNESIVSTDKFPDPEGLKISIAKNISIPFNTKDTLVYDSFIGICGNSSQDEFNRYYEPHLNEMPYLEALQKKHLGPVVVSADSTGVAKKPLNVIRLRLFGEAVSNTSVKIYETYHYKGRNHSFDKLFSYEDGKWTFRILEERQSSDQKDTAISKLQE